MKFVGLVLSIGCLLGACSSPVKPVDFKSVKSVDEKNYEYADGMQLDKFIVNNPQAFKQFTKVIIFSSQFDKLNISLSADKELAKSWNSSSWTEMDKVCQHLDDFTKKIFRDYKEFVPTNRGGEDVLAIQFTLIDFMPTAARYKDAGKGAIGTETNHTGIGVVTLRGVLANAKTGELVGLVEDTMEVNAGTASLGAGSIAFAQDSNSKAAHNLAWRKSFRLFLEKFHGDLVRLKYADTVKN
jgi:hypothetical protein